MQNKNKLSLLFQKMELRGLLKDGVFHTPIDFFAIRKPTYWEELKNSVYVIDFSAKDDFFIISTVSDCASVENLEFEIWFSKTDWNIIWAFSYNRSWQVEKMTEEQIEWIIESLFDPFEYDIVFPYEKEKDKNSKRKTQKW
ncbi:MAG: hypothetical protein ACD_71C00179G0012 [uncultured bacterium (gcode 4)]|uniref:Uncharacterized protein n=1 Tax=uncultured bacterium (gcode 4) TaxID=1234023 RepID=K1Z450_9BACT|nr:MAG: hypothetical protein ACD_71C00179G0012 [uncultured bacterium (gcode 4)]